ncbi:MAG TPA: WGR domain-containing protein, partial [Puia sp.]|nr:WGR domain-containing protein [Puia sp.]
LALYKEPSRDGLTPTLIRQQIKEQILALGYEVDEQVGQSDFRCSLAVKARPEDSQYTLGILIDDEQHYRNRNLIEQYYQRPAILEAFGWKVLPVFARDWLHQPQKVMEQVLAALSSALPPSGDTPSPGSSAASPNGNMPAPASSGNKTSFPAPAGAYDHLDFQRLNFRDAGIDKFWEAATDGNQLILRWGKTGTRGQIQMKTFPDEEGARKEKERLIKEKFPGS